MSAQAEDLAEYMAAHLLSQGVRVDAAWTATELLTVYNILPRPRVSFAEWRRRNAGPAEESDAEIAAHNDRADAALISHFKIDAEGAEPATPAILDEGEASVPSVPSVP